MTVVKDLNEPRLPNLEDLMRGRFAALKVLGREDIGADPAEIGLEGSPTRVVEIFRPAAHREGRIHKEDIETGVEETLELLAQEGLL